MYTLCDNLILATTVPTLRMLPMMDSIRTSADGYQEIRTGLGSRRVLSPASAEATFSLPVVDIGDIGHPDRECQRSVAREICHAAANVGFFYVSKHGVPANVIESIFSETRRFSQYVSLDEKMQYDTEKHEHYYGYYPVDLDPNLPAGASMLTAPRTGRSSRFIELNEGINYGCEPSIDPGAATSENNGDNWWPSEKRLPRLREECQGVYVSRAP